MINIKHLFDNIFFNVLGTEGVKVSPINLNYLNFYNKIRFLV